MTKQSRSGLQTICLLIPDMNHKANKHDTRMPVLVVLLVLAHFAQAACDLGFVLLLCAKV